MNSFDLKFINEAHNIAEKNFGKTFPNPVVGCVIAKNGKLISKGVTSKSGRPHAEEIAIRKAGIKAKGSTMYVTLEPCFHNSPTGSCADQILRSGIKEIFVSITDPDPRTNNKSIKKLKLNKITVHTRIEEEKTLSLNNFFFKKDVYPSKLKVILWDKVFTPLTIVADFCLGYKVGKNILCVYEKEKEL